MKCLSNPDMHIHGCQSTRKHFFYLKTSLLFDLNNLKTSLLFVTPLPAQISASNFHDFAQITQLGNFFKAHGKIEITRGADECDFKFFRAL